ncbi:alanyl aminopeptidase, Metallo peptidase, MEROPS family M01 [Magnetococcus marinus MC-1]|uniref:Aminopeptidase N n=1 Tax=Magnetococcus marinus (strain ATCC BAA-1437 / JCM 17883 / MC-1) TaxID=156889 RepID=A0L8Y4_MAGMM|nr:aminopeptidase N [Magnetococcus marinus]ABK44427.1 alanyl aminopeptidase, Metallo peptidase, MEROPS family M01 [Magnetococcus marinus MC-1]
MSQRKVHNLKAYRPPHFLVEQVTLTFELDPSATRVEALTHFKRHPDAPTDAPLQLHGEELQPELLEIVGQQERPHYHIENDRLTLTPPAESFTLRCVTRIAPDKNSALDGLYISGGMFCTQCEAEGFRKITYYPDRPDVMAKFRVTLIAEAQQYPILLSNGDKVATADLGDGRHSATYEDPYPKPSYLFALVAGDLALLEDHYTTAEGRKVTLQLYSEHHSIDQCGHAMQALKKAMQWEESRYGLSYDLNTYMIVAVGNFNMGAMENKGLNIFNTKYVLAAPHVATDAEYEAVEGVIAHEYFHNWTGNRITCRDWFQLSLKEGLTVYRDQSFSADIVSGSVQRIQDVRLLRNHQFPEDAGPTAHPVQPESYIEINNFYTSTIYNKGAEVIRMLETLLGWPIFRQGMDLYVARHDGQAATVEQFICCMEDASGRDLGQFRLWYVQAGTPELTFNSLYYPESQRYVLNVTQVCPPTPGQLSKAPMHIPIRMALLDPDGQPQSLKLVDGEQVLGAETVLELTTGEATYTFEGVSKAPTPSLMRGFSAPVKWDAALDREALAFLWANDNDPFNRWESGQILAVETILDMVGLTQQNGELPDLPESFAHAFETIIKDGKSEPALLALSLSLPTTGYIMDRMDKADPHLVYRVRQHVRQAVASRFRPLFLSLYGRHYSDEPYHYSPANAGARALKNLALDYLLENPEPTVLALAHKQFHQADNITDWLGAYGPLLRCGSPSSSELTHILYTRCKDSANALDKWFSTQVTMVAGPEALSLAKALTQHPDFSWSTPNKVRAVVGSFSGANPTAFHAIDGSGYGFLQEVIAQLDEKNPQLAARLCTYFTRWRRMVPELSQPMQNALQRLLDTPNLSNDTYEIVSKSLAEAGIKG